jgi:hypothetical protein
MNPGLLFFLLCGCGRDLCWSGLFSARSFKKSSSHLHQLKTVAGKQGGGNPDDAVEPAGRAAAFQKNGGDWLLLGKEQRLPGSGNELGADIPAIPGDDLGLSRKHGMAIAFVKVSGASRGRKASHLFWAERNPDSLF